jgi:UDP-GlcNAc:undecaprenyl-phosphate/decaprenyl-phosphate GlcNAc-1-phosphate transferase
MMEMMGLPISIPMLAGHLATSAILSLLVCLIAPYIGRALGLIDDPKAKAHSLHERKTPLVGGIAVLLPWGILTGTDAILVEFLSQPSDASHRNGWLAVFILAIGLVGALDDRFHLTARLRLAVMGPMFMLFAFFNPAFGIDTFSSPAFGISVALGFFALPFTALCLLAFTNAVNMTDGRNGLVIGLSLIWCLTLSFYVPADFRVMLYAVMASLLVTGLFNLRGRLFLGDTGTYGLAALVGLTGLYAHGIGSGAGGVSSTQLAAIYAIPGLDMFRLIMERAARGASPMAGDHDHLHHRLERFIGWRLGLPVYLALVGAPILIACSAPHMGTPGLIAAIVLYGAAWLVTRRYRQYRGLSGGSPTG